MLWVPASTPSLLPSPASSPYRALGAACCLLCAVPVLPSLTCSLSLPPPPSCTHFACFSAATWCPLTVTRSSPWASVSPTPLPAALQEARVRTCVCRQALGLAPFPPPPLQAAASACLAGTLQLTLHCSSHLLCNPPMCCGPVGFTTPHTFHVHPHPHPHATSTPTPCTSRYLVIVCLCAPFACMLHVTLPRHVSLCARMYTAVCRGRGWLHFT